MFHFLFELILAGYHIYIKKPPAVLPSGLSTNLYFMHKFMNLSILNATMVNKFSTIYDQFSENKITHTKPIELIHMSF